MLQTIHWLHRGKQYFANSVYSLLLHTHRMVAERSYGCSCSKPEMLYLNQKNNMRIKGLLFIQLSSKDHLFIAASDRNRASWRLINSAKYVCF